MEIGFACKTIAVPGTAQKNLTQKNATEDNLRSTIGHNLNALGNIFNYAAKQQIRLFRISSDIIPFGSHPANQLNWQHEFADTLRQLGEKALEKGIRLSMHPGQYTVLNSPHPDVVTRAIEDLAYHCHFLDALALPPSHKIILHVGGIYGDKPAAMARFIQQYHSLPPFIKKRLVIENDDRCFTVEDVLDICNATGAPAVFDNLHHQLNPPATVKIDEEWITACRRTWAPPDGRQKIHYSQQANGGKPGAHSASISSSLFIEYYKRIKPLNPDIMLEVKDKNRSAVKCVLLTSGLQYQPLIEQEWGRYKYLIMERDLNTYREIRRLMHEGTCCTAANLFALLEQALAASLPPGSAVNAAQHVWGYFKNKATPRQSRQFFTQLERYSAGQVSLSSVKKSLYRLACEYQDAYLLQNYYFDF